MKTQVKHLIFATRPSALARYQTQWVIRALQAIEPALTCEEVVITTQGDKILDKPLPEIGGKGLFTQELEDELLSGKVHCAVHSLKDLPVENPAGLTIGCIPVRAEMRDVLISARGYTLERLPKGAQIGTSSLRRSAQLLSIRPDLRIQSLRGNIDTRVRKAMNEEYDAIVLAGAGVTRLALDRFVSEWLPADVLLPAPGQGALAVQCRQDDWSSRELLNKLEDPLTRLAVTAERQFLLGLGGGCSAPVAAYATVNESTGMISLTGRVLSVDGSHKLDYQADGTQAVNLGHELAKQALAEGAGEILSMAVHR